MKATFMCVILALVVLVVALPAQGALMYADEVTNIIRGDPSIGDFAGYYGGQYPGAFPVPLTKAQAKAAVLGPPDSIFLSLPGRNDVASGSAWPHAYVEVSFPGNFGADSAVVTEIGANAGWYSGRASGNGSLGVVPQHELVKIGLNLL